MLTSIVLYDGSLLGGGDRLSRDAQTAIGMTSQSITPVCWAETLHSDPPLREIRLRKAVQSRGVQQFSRGGTSDFHDRRPVSGSTLFTCLSFQKVFLIQAMLHNSERFTFY